MRIFGDLPSNTRNKLQWDAVAEFSTTNEYVGRRISEILSRLGSKCIDATACVGGMTRFLSTHFDHVTAYEIDSERFGFLKNNIEVLSLKNVTCIHGDCLNLCERTDVIFIDPPWGGPGYKNSDSIRLELSEVPLHEVCDRLAKYTKYIALKVPQNFDERHFLSHISLCVTHQKYQFIRMNFLILKTCSGDTCFFSREKGSRQHGVPSVLR